MAVNIDGNGIGGLGGLDGFDGGANGGGSGLHLTYDAQIFSEPLRRGEVQFWEGGQDDILEKFKGLKVGTPTNEFRFISGEDDDWGTPFIGGVQAPRRKGKTWTMSVRVVQCRKAVLWTIDFAEIQKDIRTWLQDLPTSGAGSDVTDNEASPDLTAIAQWERAKELQDWEAYDNFKTVDGDELKDNTLKLARMIRKGIESYTIHTPVPTLTMQYFDGVQGAGKLLDKYLTEIPSGPPGWTELGGTEMWEQMNALTHEATFVGDVGTISYKWLCVADKATPNGDGSTTRTVQFMRVNKVEEDLYGAGNAADGGLG